MDITFVDENSRVAKGYFHGNLETSQDVTEFRKLEGQPRFMDWEYWDRRLL